MSAGAGNQGKGGADAQPERKKQSILGILRSFQEFFKGPELSLPLM